MVKAAAPDLSSQPDYVNHSISATKAWHSSATCTVETVTAVADYYLAKGNFVAIIRCLTRFVSVDE